MACAFFADTPVLNLELNNKYNVQYHQCKNIGKKINSGSDEDKKIVTVISSPLISPVIPSVPLLSPPVSKSKINFD